MQRYDYALTCGVFDVLHQGHINLLQEMSALSPNLVIMIHDDVSTFRNKGRFTIQRLRHRIDNILSVVDAKIYPVHECVPDFKRVTSQQSGKGVFVRGDDWKDFLGKEGMDLDVVFVPYTKTISTTKIYEQNK